MGKLYTAICLICKKEYSGQKGSKYCSLSCFGKSQMLILPEITTRQMEIINGGLLGDATIKSTKHGNCLYGESKTSICREYLEWLFDEFGKWSGAIYDMKKGKYFISHFVSRKHRFWTDLRNLWYPNGIKIIPTSLILSPLTLATWYCGDGCNVHYHGSAILCTNGFQIEEVEILREKLDKMFNIQTTLHLPNKQPVIYIRAKSYKDFIEIVSPHVVCKCFAYKIHISNKMKNIVHRKTEWELTCRQGEKYKTNNLSNFAKDHGLDASHLCKVNNGKIKKHKGWTCRAIG